MDKKHNPVLVLKFAGKNKDKDDDDTDDGESDNEEALEEAAKQIRKADTDSDFAEALKAFIDICSMSDY